MPGRPSPSSRRSPGRPKRRRPLAVRIVAAGIIVAVSAPATATARTADSQPPSWPEGTTDLGDITGVVSRKFRDEALDSVNNPSDYFRFELTARRAVRLVARKLTLEADLFVEDPQRVDPVPGFIPVEPVRNFAQSVNPQKGSQRGQEGDCKQLPPVAPRPLAHEVLVPVPLRRGHIPENTDGTGLSARS